MVGENRVVNVNALRAVLRLRTDDQVGPAGIKPASTTLKSTTTSGILPVWRGWADQFSKTGL
jgi:hypothetical protein